MFMEDSQLHRLKELKNVKLKKFSIYFIKYIEKLVAKIR
jgi:hypothetical protein